MTDPLQKLIDCLRDELQQYGEMLALLDRQQELVVARATDDILDTVARVNAQGQIIQDARKLRELAQQNLAGTLGLEPNATGQEVQAVVPPDYQPLIGALLEENNQLLFRIQQRARQNHVLLTRSLELMQRLISSLLPTGRSSTYAVNGSMLPQGITTRSLYEAVV